MVDAGLAGLAWYTRIAAGQPKLHSRGQCSVGLGSHPVALLDRGSGEGEMALLKTENLVPGSYTELRYAIKPGRFVLLHALRE